MDAAQILLFATMLLETAKTMAINGAYQEECAKIASRAADLFDKALEMSQQPKTTTIWTVWLASYGDKKIPCIKAARGFTNLGLKEAKELVEACPCSMLSTADESLARRMYEEFLEISYTRAYDGAFEPSGVKVELRKVEVAPA
jgi:ribosomal protein L7/L12